MCDDAVWVLCYEYLLFYVVAVFGYDVDVDIKVILRVVNR